MVNVTHACVIITDEVRPSDRTYSNETVVGVPSSVCHGVSEGSDFAALV